MRLLELGGLVIGAVVLALLVLRATSGMASTETHSMRMEKARAVAGNGDYSRSGHRIARLSHEEVEKRAEGLTDHEREVLLGKGTEACFTGELLENKDTGTYTCRLCGLPLFTSDTKFNSGTGWPSFFLPVDPQHIHYEEDSSFGMKRVEVQCQRCGSHLGHVFDDGPPPTGRRYCINSVALGFYKKGEPAPPESRPVETETAYFAGGCFWGIEDQFQQVPGVIDAVSGYQGGHADDPSYKEVCSGGTGHAETVRVTYDPAAVSYRELLTWFFKMHDPTQLNRQGPDVGSQYRSAIFTANAKQMETAKAVIAELQESERFKGRKIVTQVEPADTFYEAEEYHQDYHAKHGGSCSLPQ